MGFFSAELNSMVELYQRETAELMEEFGAKQAGAVREGRFSPQDINAIFRVVHTIKSSAAMMGLADISSCTHRMEDLFLLFRDKPERTQGQENRIFDLMDRFSDYVNSENSRVTQKNFQPKSAEAVLGEIQKELAFFGGEAERAEPNTSADSREPAAGAPSESAQIEAEKPVLEADELIWKVTLRPNCQMENVRAFMLVRQLGELCGKIGTEPSNLELPGAAEQIARNGLLLTLHTGRAAEAAKRLSASPYVLRVEEIGQNSTADAGAEKTQPAPAEDAAPDRQNKFSMVSWEHVVRLQNVTGELITANTILDASIKKLAGSELENEFQAMKRLCGELEKLVAAVSMMPVSSAMPQYYRLVRDVAARENKQIHLKVIGEELEVDRNLLDTLANPLIHLLRNAADHGIESPAMRAAAGKDPCGTITLKFTNLTDHLLISVEDDGAGMDRRSLLKKAAERGVLTKDESRYSDEEILNLAFLPGLTTNDEVSQYSGRGVGMDVALSVVSNLGGSVSIASEPGKGSTIVLEVPVSMTSAECIRFSVGAYVCLLPIRCVVQIYSFDAASDRLQTIDGHLWLQTDELLPVLDLFRLYGAEPKAEERRLVVIRDAKGSAALLTGPVTGQQTAVEKPLPELLGRRYRERIGVIGCTVTETGRLGIMLNADRLISLCGKERGEDGNA